MALTVDQKRLRATKFPPEFDKKVNYKILKKEVIKKWVAERITKILGDEDDVVIETAFNLLDQDDFVSLLAVCRVRARSLTSLTHYLSPR